MNEKYVNYLKIFSDLSEEEKKCVILENINELREYLSTLTATEPLDFSGENFYEDVILNLIVVRELNAIYINQINN